MVVAGTVNSPCCRRSLVQAVGIHYLVESCSMLTQIGLVTKNFDQPLDGAFSFCHLLQVAVFVVALIVTTLALVAIPLWFSSIT